MLQNHSPMAQIYLIKRSLRCYHGVFVYVSTVLGWDIPKERNRNLNLIGPWLGLIFSMLGTNLCHRPYHRTIGHRIDVGTTGLEGVGTFVRLGLVRRSSTVN